jgi:hypothetical protein
MTSFSDYDIIKHRENGTNILISNLIILKDKHIRKY